MTVEVYCGLDRAATFALQEGENTAKSLKG